MNKVYFIEGGRLLGIADWPDEWRGDCLWGPLSTAFFCPECGEVWARIVCAERPFEIFRIRCPRHAKRMLFCVGVDGVFSGRYHQYQGELPDEVVKRDFLVLMHMLEKNPGGYIS